MFYTIGQRKKWERVLYIVLPILSVALVVLAYAVVQMRLPLLLPDAGEMWARFLKTFTNPIKEVNLIGHICAHRPALRLDPGHLLRRYDRVEQDLQGPLR